jgi:hypothetical protein
MNICGSKTCAGTQAAAELIIINEFLFEPDNNSDFINKFKRQPGLAIQSLPCEVVKAEQRHQINNQARDAENCLE